VLGGWGGKVTKGEVRWQKRKNSKFDIAVSSTSKSELSNWKKSRNQVL